MKKIYVIAVLLLVFSVTKAQMVLKFNTNLSSGTEVTLPLYGTVSASVDWGDGGAAQSVSAEGDISHTYASEGTYTVTVSGTVTHFGKDWSGVANADKLTEVTSWTGLGLTDLSYAFSNCSNLTHVPTSLPSGITTIEAIFNDATSFNQNINSWDVSNMYTFGSVFRGASSFNQPLNSWDVGNSTYFCGMFYEATSFNQALNFWDMSKAIYMGAMFTSARAFNQPIDDWDVSKVTGMSGLFYRAASFNQPLNSWDVSKVTDMSTMFCEDSAFNQPLNNWNTESVTTMVDMFSKAISFNQNIDSWDLSSVYSTADMFQKAVSFNQPLNSWDVSNVTSMGYMFSNADNFNQPLDNWDVSKVTDMGTMFHYTSLSTENYDKILNAWSQLTLENNVDLGVAGTKYSCNSASAHQAIITNFGWTITDDGQVAHILVPDKDQLDTLYANTELTQADVTAPTATMDCSTTITGTTSDLPVSGQGTHTITWTYNNNGFTSQQTQVVIIAHNAGIKDISTQVMIYPNPVDKIINIKSDNNILNVQLTDLSGKILVNRNNAQTIDFSGFSTGIYILKIETEKGISIHKIIKK